MTAIRAAGLSVAYQQKTIIDRQSLSIPAGKISVLLGANGCGKSTLLKALAGLIASEGDIELQGQPLGDYSPRQRAKRLSFLPQQPSAPDNLTVAELVMQGRHPHRSWLSPVHSDDHQAVQLALQQTDLVDLAQRPLGALSGGQRQRAWLAMVLAQRSDILFLDEPTSYLDLNHQYALLALVRKLNREQGKTVVMVLHDLNQAFEFADQLFYLKQGRIIAEGSPAQTATVPLIEQVFGLSALIQTHPVHGGPLLIPLHAGQQHKQAELAQPLANVG